MFSFSARCSKSFFFISFALQHFTRSRVVEKNSCTNLYRRRGMNGWVGWQRLYRLHRQVELHSMRITTLLQLLLSHSLQGGSKQNFLIIRLVKVSSQGSELGENYLLVDVKVKSVKRAVSIKKYNRVCVLLPLWMAAGCSPKNGRRDEEEEKKLRRIELGDFLINSNFILVSS
jgi:hypothetical protein